MLIGALLNVMLFGVFMAQVGSQPLPFTFANHFLQAHSYFQLYKTFVQPAEDNSCLILSSRNYSWTRYLVCANSAQICPCR
jgi:hypothetical protein